MPLIITTGTGREGKQIIDLGMAAPTGAIAAIRSAMAHPTLMAMNPPSERPVAYTRNGSTETFIATWSSI